MTLQVWVSHHVSKTLETEDVQLFFQGPPGSTSWLHRPERARFTTALVGRVGITSIIMAMTTSGRMMMIKHLESWPYFGLIMFNLNQVALFWLGELL